MDYISRQGAVCHIYEASASRKSGIFLSKSVRIGCKYHSKILAGDCGDRSSGNSSGNDRRNRDWSLADFFETQAASWRAFTGTLLIGGVPNFVAALLLMLVFGVWLKWLPVSGLDSWKNYILPVCALALYPACSLARLTGTLLAQEKQRDYVLLARTKGLKKDRSCLRTFCRISGFRC